MAYQGRRRRAYCVRPGEMAVSFSHTYRSFGIHTSFMRDDMHIIETMLFNSKTMLRWIFFNLPPFMRQAYQFDQTFNWPKT